MLHIQNTMVVPCYNGHKHGNTMFLSLFLTKYKNYGLLQKVPCFLHMFHSNYGKYFEKNI